MFIKRRYWRIRAFIDEYPRHFWTLVVVTFIDRLGGAILFPFFTLYITRRFGVGMTTVGIIFGLFSLSSVFGNTIGGALTDRMGRKWMILFGLVFSALSSLWLGLVDQINLFFIGAVIVGLLADAGQPARQAMVADLLPEEQRADGYGIIRVAFNLSVTLGPAIGGFLAAKNYFFLFAADAIASLFVAVIIYLILPETKVVIKKESQETMGQTFKGYGRILKDSFFMVFLLASSLMVLAYLQMNSTLAVFLRDVHGVVEQGFGYIMSLNAGMVVLFQFSITRRVRAYPPMAVMAVGTVLYAIGFGMYGFVAGYGLFLIAMIIITIGEMVVVPVSQALVARMAPEDMRGRYMAVFGFSWIVPWAIGPLLAGLVMDYSNPRWVWYGAGLIGFLAAGIFAALHQKETQQEDTELSVA